ncbi:hypothetical protein [Bradyrhizobium sp. 1(2017)]|uniref:hypothetical protein n=1 Tax=Bradyrhizobium sp. 1(2017) TaxID=1404888 RepID=UPI00140F1174|nr:hypothetical protein [Bradyrhizobium sp. 1(2017)]QIO34330.1 hypothetical protein HAP40_22300 [Bradyrhizobium sp. 1(2017)]
MSKEEGRHHYALTSVLDAFTDTTGVSAKRLDKKLGLPNFVSHVHDGDVTSKEIKAAFKFMGRYFSNDLGGRRRRGNPAAKAAPR